MTEKKCYICNNIEPKLFRCKFDNLDWVFLCQSCLSQVKRSYKKNYEYGGTWKVKK